MKKTLLLCWFWILTATLPAYAQWGDILRMNLFSVDEDIRIGKQLQEEIAKDPKTYPILDRRRYASAYAYLERMRDQILESGAVQYKTKFEWQVHIIQNDSVLNAFVTPGGYIYVYTGLIKFLDSEDELAGVMGHEIAHADRRHSTQNMTKSYGVAFVLDLLTGGENGPEWGKILAGITGNLTGLQFSRTAESEADQYSVIYLSQTGYRCDGAAGFFRKMMQSGSAAPPEFLSTHPNSERRVRDIESHARAMRCPPARSSVGSYARFKASLP